MGLIDLPEDILSLITSHLAPRDYLTLCQVSKSVYSKHFQDSLYWRTATSNTFRLPISPLLAADGPRWYWLYKKLSTQTRLYTWGQGLKGNLGHGVSLPTHNRFIPGIRGPRGGPRSRVLPHRPPRQIFQRTSSSWPTETHVPDEVGVIADLQCGGWSTTILSSTGKLYSIGALDSMNGITIGETSSEFTQLEYLTQSTSAIRNFSSGRRHILALTDDGEIVSWDRINAKGLKVFSKNGRDFGGKPTRVVGGWALSSAYVPETGIVYWTPIKNDHSDEHLDGVHVKENIVPDTANRIVGRNIIEVTKHIVLNGWLLWITSDSKLWACKAEPEAGEAIESACKPFEVPGYTASDRQLKDLQGQFESFGVFTASGEVLGGNVDYLNRCSAVLKETPEQLTSDNWPNLTDLLSSRPRDIPALQNTGVVALAYGDHHYHAMHASGRITTYGRDSQCCGQLGLSEPQTGGRFRGLRRDATSPDGILHPIAEKRGRQIWFEPEKKEWLHWLEGELQNDEFKHDGQSARDAWNDFDRQAMFSEWIEQEGRHWTDGPSTEHGISEKSTASNDKYEDLDPYFTIAIAASGWHSGALVLVDEEKAHHTRQLWVQRKEISEGPHPPGAFRNDEAQEEHLYTVGGFPKVILPDGYTMPGHGQPRKWREGAPTIQDLGIAAASQPY